MQISIFQKKIDKNNFMFCIDFYVYVTAVASEKGSS
jgi:hypothetical protein